LHQADFWEFELLFEKFWQSYKNGWEQTRFISLVQAQTQSTKKIKSSDIITFEWEQKEVEHNDEDEIKRKSMLFQQMIENKKDTEGVVVGLNNILSDKNDDDKLSIAEKRQRQNELAKKYRK